MHIPSQNITKIKKKKKNPSSSITQNAIKKTQNKTMETKNNVKHLGILLWSASCFFLLFVWVFFQFIYPVFHELLSDLAPSFIFTT